MVKLRSAAETCKHVLSTVSTAHCFVESLCEGVDLSYNITRARFENLITSHLSEYLQPIHEALEKSGISSKIITKVGNTLNVDGMKQVSIALPNSSWCLSLINYTLSTTKVIRILWWTLFIV
jgi:molecular chaperone DnaK (HSP70)